MAEYCIYGAGRHGKVLMDFIESIKSMKLTFFIDDKNENRSAEYEGYKIIDFSIFKTRYITTCNNVLIAISDNIIRENKYNLGKEIGCNFPNFIHPTVILSPRVMMQDAVQILPGTILNTSVIIGRNTIIHSGCVIDHDCSIGHNVSIWPGAKLTGGVQIGDFSYIGTNATIIPDVRIGKNTIIGAGSTVIRDIPDNVVAVGTPAKIIKKRKVL